MANSKIVLVTVAKAQPIGDYEAVPDVTIDIRGNLPPFATLINASDYYQGEAGLIERALYNSLPGATYDRLATLMMQRIVSQFRVSHGQRAERSEKEASDG